MDGARIAPTMAGVALTVVFFTVLSNFNQLITGLPDAPGDSRSVILPAILIGGEIIGMIVGAMGLEIEPARRLRANRRDGRRGAPAEGVDVPRLRLLRGGDNRRGAGARSVPDLRAAAGREAPVAWVPAVEMWLATRWEEAVPASPPSRSCWRPTSRARRSTAPSARRRSSRATAPVHRDLRRRGRSEAAAREVEGYIDELIEPIARSHLDAIADPGRGGADRRLPGALLRAGARRALRRARRPRRRRPAAPLVRRARRGRRQLRRRPGAAGDQRRDLRRDRRAARTAARGAGPPSPTRGA